MTVGKAIYNLLLSNADLRAIVDTRIFPEVAQQDAVLPYVVYNVSSNEPSDTKREPSKLDTAQIEVNLYSTSYTECIDMATHTRAALDRVTGTYSGVNVQSIQYLGEIIDFDEAQRTYNITADYDVRISRTNFEIAQGSPITGVTLGELSDVDVTGVTDGQLIAYDAAAQEWQPADDAGGVTELGQLTDVQFGQGGPETGELLKYDGSEWTNDSIVKSEVGLGNVDNTSDADKPVSTATQTALSAKANSADFSNVDNTSDADKPVSTATQTALNAKADTSAVPTDLNDLSDVTIVGTPSANQALIYDATANAFKSLVSYTNRFEDDVETGLQMPSVSFERGYSVKSEGDGIFIDPSPDTPTAGKVIVRKIYHKRGFISDADVISDYTLIHTFADDTAYADTVATFDGFEDGATYGVPPFTLAQSWEEVTAAPAFTGLLNETYGSGAEAAYSTRRLNGNVTDCMVIRRASDSTTTTIGFDGSGNIDEAAIETFCTGTTCTVSEWTDQSGNGNDATQSDPTKQPTIYTGGQLVKEGARLALDFDGNIDVMNVDFQANTNSAMLACLVLRQDSTSNLNGALGGDASNIMDLFTDYSGTIYYDNGNRGSNRLGVATPATWEDNQHLATFYATTTNQFINVDGTQIATKSGLTSVTASYKLLGATSVGGAFFGGAIQEIVVFPSDKSSFRTSIEENIGDYFTQNTPLLDTYSGAAAAYSLRKLRTAYTGDAVEVYNGSSYADIGFNVFGELDTVALADHCGSNDGFVSKWYCQSGNSNDAVQTNTANMPKIYDGSTGVVTKNGKAAILGVSSSSVLSIANTINFSDFGLVHVYEEKSNNLMTWGLNTSRYYYHAGANHTINGMINFASGLTNGDYVLDFANRNSGAVEVHFNGASIATATNTGGYSFKHLFNAHNLTFGYTAPMQEFILWTSDQSDNRTDIESNIATFYDITI